MRSGIREFQPRQPLDRQLGANTLNQILRELESLRITRVVNGTFRKLPGGTEITVAPQRGGSSTPQTTHPFKIYSRKDPDSDPESPTYLVTVLPGTINSLLPSGIFDGGGLQQTTISNDSLQFVVLKATSDGQQIVSASIDIQSQAATPQIPQIFALPTECEFLLGAVYNSSVYQVTKDNITVTGKASFQTSKPNPAVGELPFNTYYVWA